MNLHTRHYLSIVQVDLGNLLLVVESNDINQGVRILSNSLYNPKYIVKPYSDFRPKKLKDRSPWLMAYLATRDYSIKNIPGMSLEEGKCFT